MTDSIRVPLGDPDYKAWLAKRPKARDVLLAYGNGWHGADCAGNFRINAECSCNLKFWLDRLEAEALDAATARALAAEETLAHLLALWDDDAPDPDDVERDVLAPARAILAANRTASGDEG